MANQFAAIRTSEAILATNKVIRNTYILLSMTLLFSAVTAIAGVFLQIGHGFSLLLLVGGIVTAMFILPRFANSMSGPQV